MTHATITVFLFFGRFLGRKPQFSDNIVLSWDCVCCLNNWLGGDLAENEIKDFLCISFCDWYRFIFGWLRVWVGISGSELHSNCSVTDSIDKFSFNELLVLISKSCESSFWLEENFELNMSLTDVMKQHIASVISGYMDISSAMRKALCTFDWKYIIGVIGIKQSDMKHWNRFDTNQHLRLPNFQDYFNSMSIMYLLHHSIQCPQFCQCNIVEKWYLVDVKAIITMMFSVAFITPTMTTSVVINKSNINQ